MARGKRTLDHANLDTEAARLFTAGLTYREIATQQGCSVSTAHDRVKRALAAVPAEAVAELRLQEEERLAGLWKIAWREATRDHVVLWKGAPVMVRSRQQDGTEGVVPLVDPVPKLRALAELRLLSESRRRLHGVDPPQKIRHEVITEDVVDAEIRRLEADLEERIAAQGSAPAPGV